MQSHLAIAPPLSSSVHGGPGFGQIAGPFGNFASLPDEIRAVGVEGSISIDLGLARKSDAPSRRKKCRFAEKAPGSSVHVSFSRVIAVTSGSLADVDGRILFAAAHHAGQLKAG